MKVLLSWLKDFVSLPKCNIEDFCKKTTKIGLEVENVEEHETIRRPLDGLIVGEITDCYKHPNADRLHCVKVEIGNKNILNIICGAPNVRIGLKVVVAKIGTTIHTFKGETFVIRKARIRGIDSEGMLCAEDEIGLSDNHEQIIELDNKCTVGTKVSDVYDLKKDYVFNVELTPNRGYATSHFGIAKDIAIIFDKKVQKPKPLINIRKNLDVLNINIDAKNVCSRYSGVLIKNINVEKSLSWLKNRLESVGIKAINNIVDITNYIMMSFGQPMHAYDFDKIDGDIHVRTATKNEKIKALNNKEYILDGDIVICDNKKILGLGGIIGGLETSITNDTTNVFLESAIFNPSMVRITSQRLHINTDASYRFERCVDHDLSFYCLQKAIDILQEQQKNISIDGFVDVQNVSFKQKKINTSFSYIDKKIGQSFNKKLILDTLEKLEINVEKVDDDKFMCSIPSYRHNIQCEDDIVDELLRIIGFNNVKIDNYEYNFKINTDIDNISDIHLKKDNVQQKISSFLCYNGFYEIITNPLIYDYTNGNENCVRLANVSIKTNIMRTNMLFSGLEVIKHNINYGNTFLKIFEIGRTYMYPNNEKEHLAIFITGKNTKDWVGNEEESSFFELKKILYSLFYYLNIKDIEEETNYDATLSFCNMLKFGNITYGKYGIVDNSILDKFDIKQQVFFADIYFDEMMSLLKGLKSDKFCEINNYPIVKRDLSFVFDKKIKYYDIKNVILGLSEELNIVSFNVFDVFKNREKIGTDKKAYSFSILFQAKNHTMTNNEINNLTNRIINVIETTFSAQLRSE